MKINRSAQLEFPKRHFQNQIMEKKHLFQFSVCTFNILAPCYNISSGLLESSNEEVYSQRKNQIINEIQEIDADCMCLQEFWFDENLMGLFEAGLGRRFLH